MWEQFRAALRVQVMFTAAAALAAGWLAGAHGAISAAVGGLIGVAGGLAFALVAIKSKAKSAGDVVASALKAEGAKLALMIALVIVALMLYRQAVAAALIGSFIVSALIFSIGAFAGHVRTEQKV